jgi:hypothetical protein
LIFVQAHFPDSLRGLLSPRTIKSLMELILSSRPSLSPRRSHQKDRSAKVFFARCRTWTLAVWSAGACPRLIVARLCKAFGLFSQRTSARDCHLNDFLISQSENCSVPRQSRDSEPPKFDLRVLLLYCVHSMTNADALGRDVIINARRELFNL